MPKKGKRIKETEEKKRNEKKETKERKRERQEKRKKDKEKETSFKKAKRKEKRKKEMRQLGAPQSRPEMRFGLFKQTWSIQIQEANYSTDTRVEDVTHVISDVRVT